MGTRSRYLSVLLSASLTTASWSLDGCRNSEKVQAQSDKTDQAQAPAATYATPTPDELYQLVAPIALFPDNLVAQVLAASTYPDQITAAQAWLQQNSSLKGEQLMQAVDQQPWDVSVKGLTQFADVLNQMATNLSWTSALGDAYFNIPQSVMNAVQVMRQRAQAAGNLKSNQQQNVSVQGQPPAAPAASTDSSQPVIVQAPPQTIIIQPARPQVVYVPTYNPTVVYGAPVAAYPGYSTGAVVATGLISFGLGIAVGAAISNNGCCGWGWNSWGCGWHNSTVIYNRNVYVSRSTTFVNRNNYYGRNVNNVNVNNINRNNINRNNVNANNVTRNAVNNNNYRANNFNNNARTANVSTPNFNQKYNQSQFNNKSGSAGQANRQQLTGSNSSVNQQNRGALNQNQSRPNNLNLAQNQPARGYGQQADRGTKSGAFSNYSQGGNTRTNSARGQQSLQGNRSGSASPARASGGRRQ
jgi:Protein of unknown function (DUF3300)